MLCLALHDNVRQAADLGWRNAQSSILGVWSTCGGSHSARPHIRIRAGCRGGDADGFGGERGRDRHLAGRRRGYDMGSVAQDRRAAL